MAPLVVFGHSLALGAGASRPERRFTRLVADELGFEEVNEAVGGAIAHFEPRGDVGDGGWHAVRDSASLPVEPGGAVLVFYGVNDLAALGRTNLRPYEEALRKIVARCREGDAPVLVLTQFPLENYDYWPGWPGTPIGTADLVEVLNPLTRLVAQDLGATVVELENAFPDGYRVDHAVYPGDDGEFRIAELVLTSARQANIGMCPPSQN